MDMNKLSEAQIRQRVRELGPWFHNLDRGGVMTAPDHFLGDYPAAKWRGFAQAIPADLSGKTALDVGCNAGFYSIEMKRRGAERVVGIDLNETYREQARFAAEVCGAEIEPLEKDYSFHEERIFERPGFPRLSFVEKKYSGDPTNWWIPNRACAGRACRSPGPGTSSVKSR